MRRTFPHRNSHESLLYLLSAAARRATRFLMPTRSPVLFLTRGAAVPVDLALRANLEVLQLAHNLAPVVAAIFVTLQRCSAKRGECACWILPRQLQPMNHARQGIRGNVVKNLHVSDRRGDSGGLPHLPNLAGVRIVQVYARGEFQARPLEAVLGGLAQALHRQPLATRDAAPLGPGRQCWPRHATSRHVT